MSLVTIATFSNAFNMNVLKGRLEAEGIPAFAKDEHTVTTNPLYGGALGGIKLQVREEDEDEARRILGEFGYVQPQWTPPAPVKKQKHPLVQFLIYLFWFALMLAVIYYVHDPLGTLTYPQQAPALPPFRK